MPSDTIIEQVELTMYGRLQTMYETENKKLHQRHTKQALHLSFVNSILT